MSIAPLYACLRAAAPTPALVELALEFSPRLRRHGDRAVVLDVSGLERLLGGPDVIAAELARAAADRGLPPRLAVASTQTAALLLSIDRPGLALADADPAAVLAPLEVRRLQQLVAEAAGTTLLRASTTASATRAAAVRQGRAFDMLRRWGVQTLGDLASLPAADLSARMGQDGIALQALARGEDSAPLVPDPDVPRFLERLELEWPIDTLEPLSFVLARLLDPLSAALERADRGAIVLRLELRLTDRRLHARVLSLPVPMRDPRVLRTLLLLDLESNPPPAAVDVVTIEADPAPGRVLQYSLLERALPSAETLATLTARLHALVGETRCGAPALVDTHRPDGFELQRYAPDPRPPVAAPAAGGVSAPALRAGLTGLPPEDAANPRPLDTGPPPLALTPVLRRFRPAVAVRVAVARGRPVSLAIDRRGMPGGEVVEAAGPWRTSGEWWNREGGQWDRDEWDVALTDGSLCRLYQDRVTGSWFLEGIED